MSSGTQDDALIQLPPNSPPPRWATEGVVQPWTPGEALGVGVYAFLRHLRCLIGSIAGLLLSIVFPLAGLIFVPMLAETTLATARGVAPEPGIFGRAFRRAPSVLLFGLIGTAVTFAIPLVTAGIFAIGLALSFWPVWAWAWGLLSLIPALVILFVFKLRFAFTWFFLADEDAGVLDAMRKSWRATAHCPDSIFLHGVILAPLALISLFIPVVGLLSFITVQQIGLAYGYARTTGRNDLPWFDPEFKRRVVRRLLRISFASLVALFVGLTLWVRSMPAMRGSAWSVQDTAMRAGAIVSGVIAIIVGLALLLPYALDRLEGQSFSSFVGARHIRAQKSGFLTIISILAISGVGLSSCSLSSVVSVMGGFGQDLKRKILGNNAHIVIDMTSQSAWEDYDDVLLKVRAIPGVVGATPVAHGEGMISSPSNLSGVIVRGVDPVTIGGVIELPNNIEVGKFEYLEHPEKLTRLPPTEVIGLGSRGEQFLKGTELGLPDDIDPQLREAIMAKPTRPGIIIGRELAKNLHVYVGDEVTLVSALGDLGPMGIIPRTKKFRVAAIFFSGMYEYDASHVYTTLSVADEYFSLGNKVHAIDVKVEDAERAEFFAPRIADAMSHPDLRVRDWREINRNLFSALKLERFATFIILSIAIIVASFCIICTLLLMVTEKGKEIAILKAIGASDRAILRTFMTEGMIIGAIGTVFGVTTGLALCTGLKWFGVRLDPDVYYIDRLPINVDALDFLSVALAAMVICTLATLYPAYAASTLRPVDGLRYE